MLDRNTWRTRFVAAAKIEIKAGRLDRAGMAKAFGELTPERADTVSKQAVYDWFKTGKISDDWLVHVAAFQRVDLHALKFEAVFRPATEKAPAAAKKGKPEIPDLIRDKARRLHPDVQKSLLWMIDSVLAASDPRAINLEAENHKKAMARKVKG